MNIVFMSMDTLPSTLWARDLYDQMHIRSDFRKWFPRMCQYGFIEGRDYEYMPRVRLQDEGGRTVQRYVKDYRITQDMAKKLCKLHHTAVGAAYHPQPFDWDALFGLLHKKPPSRSSYEAQLSDSDSLVTTTQIAKEYGCGAKVFNRLLHLHGIQYRANGQWVLYSEHHGKGYTSSLTFRLQRSDGSEVEKLHGDKPVQEAMTELLAEFGCDAAQGRIMDAAELREQADTVAEQQAEVLKEKLAAERPAPEETLSFYVAECLEFTFAGEFHDHLTMEEALEVYDKIPSERMNADKCIGFCIEEDGGFVGMYELVVNDKVQRENINSINYFRDDKLVQQAISDMEKLMAARQQSKEQERSSTKKSVLDALRSLKAKKQEQPAQEQDKPKKAKSKGMEL